ncbi:MAG: hypothetical protein QXI95_00565 [Candidatus Micrarchaeaceae archaeon]
MPAFTAKILNYSFLIHMMQNPKKIFLEIKELRIQGAEEVAKAGIKAWQIAKDKEEITRLLLSARPDEPMLKNSLKYLAKYGDANSLLEEIEKSREKIMHEGSNLIKDGSTIYTHCHSSTVEAIIEQAALSKKINVHATETRPHLQGRITAKGLATHGIPVDFYVDSAALYALQGATMMMIGADVITKASIINKVGSRLIAMASYALHIPVYIAADALKFDPLSLHEKVKIEVRNKNEIWGIKDKNINIHNPVFEEVPARYIKGIITQFGILSPAELYYKLKEYYKWMFER